MVGAEEMWGDKEIQPLLFSPFRCRTILERHIREWSRKSRDPVPKSRWWHGALPSQDQQALQLYGKWVLLLLIPYICLDTLLSIHSFLASTVSKPITHPHRHTNSMRARTRMP